MAQQMGHALFLEAYQKSQVIKEYLRHAPYNQEMLARNLQRMRDDPANPSAPNLYWSKNYSRGKDVHHDPPEAVRQVMRALSEESLSFKNALSVTTGAAA